MNRILIIWVLAVVSVVRGADTRPLVVAHRGASGYLPEHTLAAKAYAHALGADFLEQDLVLTKDDVPVVLHDVHIDTVTDVAKQFPARKRADGRFYALDFTLAELKQLRVTERFNAKTGAPVFAKRFPAGLSEFHISTLEEELQLIQGLNRSTGRVVGIYPEIKQPEVAPGTGARHQQDRAADFGPLRLRDEGRRVFSAVFRMARGAAHPPRARLGRAAWSC